MFCSIPRGSLARVKFLPTYIRVPWLLQTRCRCSSVAVLRTQGKKYNLGKSHWLAQKAKSYFYFHFFLKFEWRGPKWDTRADRVNYTTFPFSEHCVAVAAAAVPTYNSQIRPFWRMEILAERFHCSNKVLTDSSCVRVFPIPIIGWYIFSGKNGSNRFGYPKPGFGFFGSAMEKWV